MGRRADRQEQAVSRSSSFEKQDDTRPLTTFTSNPGGAPVGGNTTRVLASDLSALSSFLSTNFNYDTGPFDGITEADARPSRSCVKGDYNVNNANKVTFRYNQLDLEHRRSGSPARLARRRPADQFSTNFLSYQNSNYQILENIKSGIGEWNSVIGSSMSNNLLSRLHRIRTRAAAQIGSCSRSSTIFDGASLAVGTRYIVRLRAVHAVQSRSATTRSRSRTASRGSARNHSITIGGSVEKYHSDNSFFLRRPERATSTTRWPTSTRTPMASWPIRTGPSRPSTSATLPGRRTPSCQVRQFRRFSR